MTAHNQTGTVPEVLDSTAHNQTPILRWQQLLCNRHQHKAIAEGWPFNTREPLVIADDCLACATRVWSTTPDGPYIVRTHPSLTVDVRRRLAAVHEAAHVVVGIDGGMRLSYIDLPMRGGIDGRCNWPDQQVEFVTWAAMLRAGHLAADRWVRANGLDDTGTRLDIAYGGIDDFTQLRAFIAQHQLPPTQGRAHAETVLDQRWHQVLAVADHLDRRGRLDAADVAALIASSADRLEAAA